MLSIFAGFVTAQCMIRDWAPSHIAIASHCSMYVQTLGGGLRLRGPLQPALDVRNVGVCPKKRPN